ncbi:MAG: transglutaminase N-terminal domain-containing protein, partial [Bacteroidota bacterium]
MKITIKHNLTYEYSGEVSLDPHVIYLFPKVSECLILQNFKIEIYPKPSQIYQNVDLEGNIQTVAFFNQKTDRLVFDALINVQTLSFNTFDFVFFPFGASKLPFQYNEAELEILSPYLKKVGVTTLVDQVARKIAADSNWATTKFLMSLCNYIYQNFDYYIREEGLPQNPEYTLLQKA